MPDVRGAAAWGRPVRGEARTAEELGRMFAGTTVGRSSGERVVEHVTGRPDGDRAAHGGDRRWPTAATPRWWSSTRG